MAISVSLSKVMQSFSVSQALLDMARVAGKKTTNNNKKKTVSVLFFVFCFFQLEL